MQIYLQWIAEITRDNKNILTGEIWHKLCQRYLAVASHPTTLFAPQSDCLSLAKGFALLSNVNQISIAAIATDAEIAAVIASIENKGAFAQLLQMFLTCFPQAMGDMPSALTAKLDINPYELPLPPLSTPVSISDEKNEDAHVEDKPLPALTDFKEVLTKLNGPQSAAKQLLEHYALELTQLHFQALMTWTLEKLDKSSSYDNPALYAVIALYEHGSAEESALLTEKLLSNLQIKSTKVNTQVIDILKDAVKVNTKAVATAIPTLLDIIATVKFAKNYNTLYMINRIIAQCIDNLDDEQLYRWISISPSCFADSYGLLEKLQARNFPAERYLPYVMGEFAKQTASKNAHQLMALMIKQGNAHKELLPFVLNLVKSPDFSFEFYIELVEIIFAAQPDIDCQPLIKALIISFENQKEDDNSMARDDAISSIGDILVKIAMKPTVDLQSILQPLLEFADKKQSFRNQQLIDIMYKILFPELTYSNTQVEQLQIKLTAVHLQVLEKLFLLIDDEESTVIYNSLGLFLRFARKWPQTSVDITDKLLPLLGLQKPYTSEKLSLLNNLCETFEKLPELGEENVTAIFAEVSSIVRKTKKNEKLDSVLRSLLSLLSHLATAPAINTKRVLDVANKIYALAFVAEKFVYPLAQLYAQLIGLQHEVSASLLAKQIDALSSQDDVLRHIGEVVLNNIAAHQQINFSAYLPHYFRLLTSTDAYSRKLAVESLPELAQRPDVGVTVIDALSHLYSASKDSDNDVRKVSLVGLAELLATPQFAAIPIELPQADNEEKLSDTIQDEKIESDIHPAKRLKLAKMNNHDVSELITKAFNILFDKLPDQVDEPRSMTIKALLAIAHKNQYFWNLFINKLKDPSSMKYRYFASQVIKALRQIADESAESMPIILNALINLLTVDSKFDSELISQNIIEIITQTLDATEQNHYLYGVLLIKLSGLTNLKQQSVLSQTINNICLARAEQFQAEKPIPRPANILISPPRMSA